MVSFQNRIFKEIVYRRTEKLRLLTEIFFPVDRQLFVVELKIRCIWFCTRQTIYAEMELFTFIVSSVFAEYNACAEMRLQLLSDLVPRAAEGKLQIMWRAEVKCFCSLVLVLWQRLLLVAYAQNS